MLRGGDIILLMKGQMLLYCGDNGARYAFVFWGLSVLVGIGKERYEEPMHEELWEACWGSETGDVWGVGFSCFYVEC
ncbi:hypothetical protein [Bartonella sp. MR168JLCBS]|uniref:hypothetical protein n=1 Tax=Bartonella sp. MR168JLCBS TaxID=3243556 RepID=UPI0035CECFBE